MDRGGEAGSAGAFLVIDVDQTARATLDRAVEGIRETGYLEWLSNTYRRAAEDPGQKPRAWTAEDERRIRFEAIAYMSAVLLERELGVYFTRRTLFGLMPDRKRIKAFRASYLDYLSEKLGPLGLGSVTFPAAGVIPAREVTVVERLREYSGGWGGKKAYEHFGSCMGRAMDPGPGTVAPIVALESIPMLAIVIHGALDREFGTPPRPKTARAVLSIVLAVAATLALALAGDFSCFVADSLGDPNPPSGVTLRAAPPTGRP
jgi:hypothetical protein